MPSRPPRPLRLVDTMRGQLSDRALAILGALDLRRDPHWTVAAEPLREMWAARSWPVNESALEIEQLAGGLEVAPGVYFGPYAMTRAADEERARTARKAPQVLKSQEHLNIKRDASYSLVRPCDQHLLYVTATGEISMERIVQLDEDVATAILADSFIQYIEVAVLVRDSMFLPFDGTDPLGWHRLWLDRPVGAAMAGATGAAPFEPATGSACSSWVRDALHVVERRCAPFFNDTTIGTPEVAEAIEAIRLVLPIHRDVLWISPTSTVTAATLATLPHCARGGGAGFEVFVWGQPQGYLPRKRRPDFRLPT